MTDIGDEVAAQPLQPALGAGILKRDQRALRIQPLEVGDQQPVATDRRLDPFDTAWRGGGLLVLAAHHLVQRVDQRWMPQHAHQAPPGRHLAQQVTRPVIRPQDVPLPVHHQDGEGDGLQRAIGISRVRLGGKRGRRLERWRGQDFGLRGPIGPRRLMRPGREPGGPGGETDAPDADGREPERIAADRKPDQGQQGRPDDHVITEKCKERFRQRAHFPA